MIRKVLTITALTFMSGQALAANVLNHSACVANPNTPIAKRGLVRRSAIGPSLNLPESNVLSMKYAKQFLS